MLCNTAFWLLLFSVALCHLHLLMVAVVNGLDFCLKLDDQIQMFLSVRRTRHFRLIQADMRVA